MSVLAPNWGKLEPVRSVRSRRFLGRAADRDPEIGDPAVQQMPIDGC